MANNRTALNETTSQPKSYVYTRVIPGYGMAATLNVDTPVGKLVSLNTDRSIIRSVQPLQPEILDCGTSLHIGSRKYG